MADDGSDLIGHVFTTEDGLNATVLSAWTVGPPGYVLCSTGPNDTIIRPIHAVRMHKHAVARDGDSP